MEWNTEYGTRNPEHGIRNPEHGIRNTAAWPDADGGADKGERNNGVCTYKHHVFLKFGF